MTARARDLLQRCWEINTVRGPEHLDRLAGVILAAHTVWKKYPKLLLRGKLYTIR